MMFISQSFFLLDQDSPFFLLLPLVLGGLLGTLISLPLAFVLKIKRRKRFQQLSYEHKLESYFPVFYSSPNHYKKYKLGFPWEGIGFVKQVEEGMIDFRGYLKDGTSFKLKCSNNCLENIGSPNWFRNGCLPWLKLTRNPHEIYFTAEFGLFIYGARSRNEVLLNNLTSSTNSSTKE